MKNILTKPVSAMSITEAMLATRVGRLTFDPNENTPEAIREYNSLPTKKQILKQIAEEETKEQ